MPHPLPYEAFDHHVEAHFAYAKTLAPAMASALLLRRLADGTWREAPAALVNLVLHFEADLDPAAAAAAITSVVHAFATLGPSFEEGIHDALRRLVPFLARSEAGEVHLNSLVAWLEEYATPGEARLIADLVTAAVSAGGEVSPALRPLATWLLDYGSAELRVNDRRALVARLVELVAAGEPDHLPVALRVVLRRADAAHCIRPRIREPLWRALERALAAGAAPSLAVDLANALGAESAGLAFAPGTNLPNVQRALVAGLLRAQFVAPLERELWGWALATEPPADGAVGHAALAVIERALDVLPQRARLPADIERVGPMEVHVERMRPCAGWVEALLDAWLDAHGGLRAAGAAARPRLLALAACHPDVVARALRARLEAEAIFSPLCLAILDDAGGRAGGVGAAVRVLPNSTTERRPPKADLPSSFEAKLRELVHARWVESTFGVDLPSLLGSARDIAFARLSADDKVQVSGDTLLVDLGYPAMLAGQARWDAEEKDALLVLYVVHELVHIHQGIGAKSRVQALREAGAESALMHVDLAADHVAALLAAQVVRRWPLRWLKDLQGRALADFPVGATHPSGSRARKAARLVGVRVDWLVRQHELVPQSRLGQGYAFAEYGPAGGKLLVLVSGPPSALALECPLSRAAAGVLVGAADEANVGAAGLARVDAALLDSLRREGVMEATWVG